MAKEKTTDVYQIVTNRIISDLEKGIIPWEKPWIAKGNRYAISGTTGKRYSLLNQMLLGMPGKWYTYKQAEKIGAHVRKGEKSSVCVFWKMIEDKKEQKDGDDKKKKMIPILRYYNVFHESQIDGLPESEPETEFEVSESPDAEKVIWDYVNREGISLVHSDADGAYYAPGKDLIHLPKPELFKNTNEYYATAFHEMTHSTGHESRLNRFAENKTNAAFGSEEYSKEELVAEIGSAILMNVCDLETEHSNRNTSAYIQNWLSVLNDDKRFIVSASSRADKAVDYILETEEESED